MDVGYYMTLFSRSNGWSVWRIETQHDTSCKAVKAAEGRSPPIPAGVMDSFYRGSPYVSISQDLEAWRQRGDGQSLSVQLHGRWASGHTRKWRLLAGRFWNDRLTRKDLVEGRKIEVHLETWEYYSILVGKVAERGIIDLDGLNDATHSLIECDPQLLSKEELALRPPTPVGDIYRYRDYPSSAIRQSMEGKVVYRVVVNLTGKVSSCAIIESSGFELLDHATCHHLERYARFSPATDSNGEPIESKFEDTMAWQLP